MSAVAERSALAATGRDLAAAAGDAGRRRAAGLGGVTAGPPPTSFAALAQAPGWLRRPAADQVRLARVVALRSLAPALARSIDGAWLGALAQAVGEDAVDWAMNWAIANEADGDRARDATPVAPDALAARGFAILRADLAPTMHGYLGWAPQGEAVPAAPRIVADALAFVVEHAA